MYVRVNCGRDIRCSTLTAIIDKIHSLIWSSHIRLIDWKHEYQVCYCVVRLQVLFYNTLTKFLAITFFIDVNFFCRCI